MAGEFKHKSQGVALDQTEYENIDAHDFDSQATGDIPYASSATQISRLAIGATGSVLGRNTAGAPEWNASQGVKAFGSGSGTGNLEANSYNIASFAKDGTGNYTWTWDTDFADANYAVQYTPENAIRYALAVTPTTGTCTFEMRNSGGSSADAEQYVIVCGIQ